MSALLFKELKFKSLNDMALIAHERMGTEAGRAFMTSAVDLVGEVVEKRVAERLKNERGQ